MKEIILNETLTVTGGKFPEFDLRYFFDDVKGYESITAFDTTITHRNYLRYLGHCWQAHYGAVISPTILWNMVLSNLAFEVNKNSGRYRKYFTESDEKQEIKVYQAGNMIDPTLLMSIVSTKMPSDIVIHAFPDFSTDTHNSVIANYTAFLDMVSPYYNYSMYCCGIPKIRVLGTPEDWQLFADKCMRIIEIIPEFDAYLDVVRLRVLSILMETVDYSKIFSLVRCGSGSQVEVEGWISDFFIEKPSVRYPENFISCISKIDYHCDNDGKDYRFYAGLFTSKIEDGYLVPEFDGMYFVKNDSARAITEKLVDDKMTVNLNLTTVKVESEVRKLRTK
jgi:hypothetical protein